MHIRLRETLFYLFTGLSENSEGGAWAVVSPMDARPYRAIARQTSDE
jgi:hypothetical protein